MAGYNKINSFVLDLCKKVHNLSSDALTIALTTTAAMPVPTHTVLANITQINYTNLTGNGVGGNTRMPIITSLALVSGTTATLVLTDLILTASGAVAPFGGVVLYNATPTGTPNQPLIAWWAYGSDVTLANTETFTIDFDPTGGVLTIV